MAIKSSITLLRHANALPARDDSPSADLCRSLSPKGLRQTDRRRVLLGERPYGLAISSPATRAYETAQNVAAIEPTAVTIFPSLYWLNDGKAFKEAVELMFDELQYKPLAEYRKHRLGYMLDDQARQAWMRMQSLNLRGKKTLLVGHAILANALGCQMVGTLTKEWAYLSETAFDECSGVTIHWEDSEVVKVDRHEGMNVE